MYKSRSQQDLKSVSGKVSHHGSPAKSEMYYDTELDNFKKPLDLRSPKKVDHTTKSTNVSGKMQKSTLSASIKDSKKTKWAKPFVKQNSMIFTPRKAANMSIMSSKRSKSPN
jgi:hypothetical protein